jgi:hypothetical protein
VRIGDNDCCSTLLPSKCPDPTDVKKLLEDAPVNVTKSYKLPDPAIPNLQRLGCTLQNSLANPSSPHSSLRSNPTRTIRRSEQQINSSGDQYLYNTIGKIFAGANLNFASPLWTGTGVLVGPDLLLTASHTVPWGQPGWWMRFVPAYEFGNEPYGSSYVSDARGL